MTYTTPGRIRLDKWLWHARFFKSRSLAQTVLAGGRVRINGQPVAKAAISVGPGDVVTFSQEGEIRVVRVLACGTRRGPAPEAQGLYENIVAGSSGPAVAAQDHPAP